VSVEVVHWNPRAPLRTRGIGSNLRIGRRIGNFGDLLGPVIVNELVHREGLRPGSRTGNRLLAVGSILRMARDGDVLWGIGANGKSLRDPFPFQDLDVRAVRGPMTAELLRGMGIEVPEVYGDPGLLVGQLWSREYLRGPQPPRSVTVVPNLNDLRETGLEDERYLDPRSNLQTVLATIAASAFVTGSSLHAIVIAESLGIPARLVRSAHEPDFKYLDYYLGSGRAGFEAAASVEQAIVLGGEPAPRWDAAALLDAFPRDLWHHEEASTRR
jgi:pyruvyltransferase